MESGFTLYRRRPPAFGLRAKSSSTGPAGLSWRSFASCGRRPKSSVSAEPAALHEGRASGSFIRFDIEELVELRDLENLTDFRVDRAELQLDLELAGLFVHLHEFA